MIFVKKIIFRKNLDNNFKNKIKKISIILKITIKVNCKYQKTHERSKKFTLKKYIFSMTKITKISFAKEHKIEYRNYRLLLSLMCGFHVFKQILNKIVVSSYCRVTTNKKIKLVVS